MIQGPKFHGFRLPGHVALPPELFEALPHMEEAELKVVIAALVAAQQPGRWGKPITIPELERLTGLPGSAVEQGVQEAIERGFLTRFDVPTPSGHPAPAYGLVVAPSSSGDSQ